MEIKIEVPEYNPKEGMKFKWEYGFEIEVTIENGSVLIAANKAGLISLATHLLILAQEEIPSGGPHFHYDEYTSLEKGSVELIIAKK